MFAVTFSSESPNYASATHAAEFVQGAVPLGITQISWGSIGLCGVLFVSQNNLRFRTLEAIVPATHLLKITSPMLITYYSISVILSSLRKRKAYTWEVAEARMRLQQHCNE